MYPYGFYFENDPVLRKYYQNYFEENIYRLENYPELLRDVQELFSARDFHLKSKAVNILAIFKLYFLGEKFTGVFAKFLK
jgi:hypothetical protein